MSGNPLIRVTPVILQDIADVHYFNSHPPTRSRCDDLRMRKAPGVRDEVLVIPSRMYVRLIGWMDVAVGVLSILAGVSFGFAGFTTQAVLLGVGLVVIPVGWIGARRQVRCDRSGLTYRSFRSTFVSVSDIDCLKVSPVVGVGSFSRAEVAVVRKNGSEVLLDSTLVVRSGPQHEAVRAHIADMSEALGLDHRASIAQG
jgi:hypothetical protein